MNSLEMDNNIQRLVEWAESHPEVRAVLLTSSRAIPGAGGDVFSDYDVILVLEDIQPFFADRTWLQDFGPVLVVYRDPLQPNYGHLEACYVTQYENGLKIDFTLWPVEILRAVAADPVLPPEFDAGYQVLLDKDLLAGGLQAPTYHAYIPARPSEAEYLKAVEEFFQNTTYAVKLLWRVDLMAAKHILELMLQENLRPVLEWHIETEHNWSVKPGPYGRRMKKWLRPDLWQALETCYAGAGLEENWESVFKIADLFRKTAVEVGERLGYAYPHDLDRRATAYFRKVQNLAPGADKFA